MVFHVRGVFANLQTKEHITTRTNFGGNLDDDKQNELRRQTENIVKRQRITNETVTFPRRLTDNVVQRQHTMNEDTTPLQPIQKDCTISLPTTRNQNPVKLVDNTQTQDMPLTNLNRRHSTPLTTDGDCLISTRTTQHTSAIPTQSTQMEPNNQTSTIELVKAKDADTQRPHRMDQNHIGMLGRVIKASPQPNQEVGKENGLQHPLKTFLTPFKHGFHREIVESPTGKRITHYITSEGEKITDKNNLGPHIKHLKDITEENFTFQPTEFPIRDPLNKYQSIRQVKPHRRYGPYRPAFGEISA